MKNDRAVAKIAGDWGISKNRLLQAALTGNRGVIGKQVMADATIQAAKERAKGKGAGGAPKKTDLDKSYEAELAALLDTGEPNDAATRKKAMNAAQAQLSKSAGTARVELSKVEKANEAFENRMISTATRELRASRTKDPVAYKAGVKALKQEIEREFGVAPTAKAVGEDAPTTSASAPAAVSSTPPVNKLKEGVATKFGNGQTWTLKNGQPVQVK